jgi:hypothetical protein
MGTAEGLKLGTVCRGDWVLTEGGEGRVNLPVLLAGILLLYNAQNLNLLCHVSLPSHCPPR